MRDSGDVGLDADSADADKCFLMRDSDGEDLDADLVCEAADVDALVALKSIADGAAFETGWP